MKVAVSLYEFWCRVPTLQGRMNERCAEASSLTFPQDSLIYPFVSLFWSLFLCVPSISVHSNLSMYLYYPLFHSPPALTLSPSLPWPLSSWPSYRRSPSCFPGIDTWWSVSHGAGFVQSDVVILWEFSATVWYVNNLHLLPIGSDDQ